MVVPGFSPLILCSHGIDVVDWIVVAVAEEIVIAGVEKLRVFAHEPPKTGVVKTRSVIVDPSSQVFSAGKKETVAVGTAISPSPVRCVDAGRSERVIAVPLDNRAVGVCEMRHTPLVVLVEEIPVPLVVSPV